MKARELLEHMHGAIARIAEANGVRRLEAFGSTARGTDRADSDVDLLVEFAPAAPSLYAERYFALQEALEATLGRPVELVETGAIDNPYFLEAIAADRFLLYATRS